MVPCGFGTVKGSGPAVSGFRVREETVGLDHKEVLVMQLLKSGRFRNHTIVVGSVPLHLR